MFVVYLGVGLEVVSNIVNGWFILGVSYLRMSFTFSCLKDNLERYKILGSQHFPLKYVQLLLSGVFYCLVFNTWWVSCFFLSALSVKKKNQFLLTLQIRKFPRMCFAVPTYPWVPIYFFYNGLSINNIFYHFNFLCSPFLESISS